MSTKAQADLDAADLLSLLELSAFKRFLFRVVTESGIHSSAYGSEQSRLAAVEGRRSLGFDVLRWVEESLRLDDRGGLAALTMILLEASKSAPTSSEKPHGKRSERTNRFDELGSDRDGGGDDSDE